MSCPGNYVGYSYGCRCEACRAGWRDYQRDRRRDEVSGQPRLVSPAEARGHLRNLVAIGYSPTAIASATGVSRSGIQRILRGGSENVRRPVSEAILAVPVNEIIPGHDVPAHIVERLTAELERAGIPRSVAAQAAGLNPGWEPRGVVFWDTWRRIATLYGLLAREGVVPGGVLREVEP